MHYFCPFPFWESQRPLSTLGFEEDFTGATPSASVWDLTSMAGLGGQCPGKGCTFNMATQIQSGGTIPSPRQRSSGWPLTAERGPPRRRRHRRDTVAVAVAMCTESLGLLQGQHDVRQLGRQPAPRLQGMRPLLRRRAGARGCVQHPRHQRRILLCRHLRLNVRKFSCG